MKRETIRECRSAILKFLKSEGIDRMRFHRAMWCGRSAGVGGLNMDKLRRICEITKVHVSKRDCRNDLIGYLNKAFAEMWLFY